MTKEHVMVIKEKVKERIRKIALTGNSDYCCMPGECYDNNNISSSSSPIQAATFVGYNSKELESIPKSSMLGVGCGTPIQYAQITEAKLL
jgi:hypothetical protein